MGAVITFPQVQRELSETPPLIASASAAIIILPAIRIERASDSPPGTETETNKNPSGRKPRKRAARP
jgi:hypothetical protein